MGPRVTTLAVLVLIAAGCGGESGSTGDDTSGSVTTAVDLRRGFAVGGYDIGPGAELAGADLTEADLHAADLTGADLTGAILEEADLSGARLTDADLDDADLVGADLTGADLTGASLSDIGLMGADLTGANLTGAQLTLGGSAEADGVVWNGTICPDGVASDANGSSPQSCL